MNHGNKRSFFNTLFTSPTSTTFSHRAIHDAANTWAQKARIVLFQVDK